MSQYELDPNLEKNACKYCAALLIEHLCTRIDPSDLDRIPNGTVTFIKCDGLPCAVTCQHVVDSLRQRNARYSGYRPYAFATEVNGRFLWKDAFRQPSSGPGGQSPDIGLQLIRPDFPAQIGKMFFELRPNSPKPPTAPRFAIAVGFPTGDKSISSDEGGDRLRMPCVQAIADESSVEGNQFWAILSSQPDIKHLSGLSGGPVFWSTKDTHGLLGLVYQGSPTTPTKDGLVTSPKVQFAFVSVTYETFSAWIDDCHLRQTPIPPFPWVWSENMCAPQDASPEGDPSDE